jgi:YHS domain-containing protein
MAIDPVCGMSVDEKSAPAKADYKGKTYYFCSADCKTKFQQQPDKYAKA